MTLDGLADVLFGGLRLLKKSRAVKAALEDPGILGAPVEDLAGLGLTGQEFNCLGDPRNENSIS